MNSNTSGYKEIIFFILLFIFSLNIGLSSFVPILLLMVYLIFTKNKYSLPFLVDIFIIILFIIFYFYIPVIRFGEYHFKAVYYNTEFNISHFYSLRTLITTIVLAMIGYSLGRKRKNIESYFLCFIIGANLIPVLSVFQNIITTQIAIGTTRQVPSIWRESEFIYGPSSAIFLSLGICLLYKTFTKTNLLKKIIYGLIGGSCFFTSLYLDNRTSVLILIIVLCLNIVMSFSKKTIWKTSLIIGFLGVILLLTFNKMMEYLKTSNLSIINRLQDEGIDSPRYVVWKEALAGLPEHLFGGLKIPLSVTYAHNFWLDIGWAAGIVPLIIILIYQLRSAYILKWAIKVNKRFILTTFLVILISLMIEPILFIGFQYFQIFIFILSMLRGKREVEKKEVLLLEK